MTINRDRDMTLKRMPGVGDKVIYDSDIHDGFMTMGKQYTVIHVGHGVGFLLSDDYGDNSPWLPHQFYLFKKAEDKEEASPETDRDLIIALSRTVAEQAAQLDEAWSSIYALNEEARETSRKTVEARYMAGQALTSVELKEAEIGADRMDIEMLIDDMVTIDERTQPLVSEEKKTSRRIANKIEDYIRESYE